MKARRVKGLDPDGPLVDNMRRVILVRLDELYGFIPAALDPDEVEYLHDMRIAAKRLRYLLELSEPLFGKAAKRGAKVAKDLQGLLGDIHDCDELLPLLGRHVDRLRGEDALAAVDSSPALADDLDPALVAGVPNRANYRGLELLTVYTDARRRVLHSRFVREWQEIEASDFREELEDGLRPEPPREPQ